MELPLSAILKNPKLKQLVTEHANDQSAYLNLQAGVSYFTEPGLGIITYTKLNMSFKSLLVFSNPICDDDKLEALISRFMTKFDGYSIKFLACNSKVAAILSGYGYDTNLFGDVYNLNLADFDLKGKKFRHLRGALNQCKDMQVKEQSWSEVDTQRVREISEKWIKQKSKYYKKNELNLLTRPPVFKDEWGTRKFYAYKNNKLVGYVFFDPYFENGQIKGYLANILRKDPSVKPASLLDRIIVDAAFKFKEEGITELSLGLSPLSNIGKHENDNPFTRKALKFLYEKANFAYNFKGLEFHKSRYPAETEATFLCTKGFLKFSPIRLMSTLNVF